MFINLLEVLFSMKAVIVNFRGAYKSQEASNHVIVMPEGAKNREGAQKLVGKKIVWNSPKGNPINGKVAGAHGNKGSVRVIFEKGLPGQALSTEAQIE